MAFSLIVEAGPQTGQVFALDAKAVLGRGQFADVQISDLAVSRRHAEIEPEDDGWRFRDLDSANGTRCNGRALQAPVRLSDGDLIDLGQTRLRVRMDKASAPPSAEAALETQRPPDPPPPARASSAAAPAAAPLARTAAVDDVHLLAIPRLQALARLGTMAAAPGPTQLQSALALLAECFPRCQRFVWLANDPAQAPLAMLGLPASALPWARRCGGAAISQQALLCNDSGFAAALIDAAPPIRPAAWAALPLGLHGRVLGAVYFDSTDTDNAIRPQDQTFIAGLSGALAVLMSAPQPPPASAADDCSALQWLRQQQIPTSAPALAGYTIAVRAGDQAAQRADRHDFLHLADGRLALLISSPCDVGLAAEIVLARIGAYARALAPRARSPADLLGQLNRLVRTEFGDSVPIAALLAAFDPGSHRVSLASAGQALPWVARGAMGCTEAVLEPAPALGQHGEPALHEALVELPADGGGMLLFGRQFGPWLDPDGSGNRAAAARQTLITARSAQGALAMIDQAAAAPPPASPAAATTLIAIWRRFSVSDQGSADGASS